MSAEEVTRLRAEAARLDAVANGLAIPIGESRCRLGLFQAESQTKFLHDPTN